MSNAVNVSEDAEKLDKEVENEQVIKQKKGKIDHGQWKGVI